MSPRLSRRSILVAGVGMVGLAATAACGADSPSPSASPGASPGTPRRGGKLRVGVIGSSGNIYDPHFTSSDTDQGRGQQIADSLALLAPDLPYRAELALAESFEMNADATVATIRLRSGVEFHHGKSLTADDLIFSLQRILDPDNPGRAASSLASIDPNAIKKLDNLTVELTLKTPDSLLPTRWGSSQTSILPTDFDPAKPVGTGPWVMQSFQAGARSTYKAFPNYWREGQPYLDELEIIDFADNTPRMAALLAGQVDAIDGVDSTLIPQLPPTGFTTVITKSGFYQPITMRVDSAPFNDPNVRLAMKLLVDREQMVQQAYSGLGEIANDMPCPGDPGYPDLPQREQDIEQAKSLLKNAGYEGLTITLNTSAQNGGMVNSAQVYAEQAKAAGVTVNINIQDAATWSANHKEDQFKQNYWAAGLVGGSWSQRWSEGGRSNESLWQDPEGDQIYNQLLSTTDPAKQAEYSGQLLTKLYESGPDIIHSFKSNVDLTTDKLKGVIPMESNGWNLGSWRYRLMWLEG